MTILKNVKYIALLAVIPAIFLGLFFASNVTYAQTTGSGAGTGGATGSGAGAGGVTGSGAGVIPSVELINPLKNINSIGDLLEAILHIIMILMIPIIVFYIIYSGFKYVTALGNASQVEEASQSLLYAVIGGVLILGSLAIVEIIKNIVAQF